MNRLERMVAEAYDRARNAPIIVQGERPTYHQHNAHVMSMMANNLITRREAMEQLEPPLPTLQKIGRDIEREFLGVGR